MDKASQVLAQGDPPGVPESFRALADHGDVPRTTLQHRAKPKSRGKRAQLKEGYKCLKNLLGKRSSSNTTTSTKVSREDGFQEEAGQHDRPEHASTKLGPALAANPAQSRNIATTLSNTQRYNDNKDKGETALENAVEPNDGTSAVGNEAATSGVLDKPDGTSLPNPGIASSANLPSTESPAESQGTSQANDYGPAAAQVITPPADAALVAAMQNPAPSGTADAEGTIASATATALSEAASAFPGPTWVSNRTPYWNQAIATWQESEKGKIECAALETLVNNRPIDNVDFLSQVQPDVKSSSKWRLRLKRCEPILNATRGIAVTLAAADPHKVAPLVVHSVFAGINILFNRMSPENRDKMLDILFGCSDAIRECISFEVNCQVTSEKNIEAIRSILPNLYLKALRLVYEVQSSCRDVQRKNESTFAKVSEQIKIRGLALWRELSDKMAAWESEQADIKRLVGEWTRFKKTMEEEIKVDEYVAKVREWVRAEDDSELTLDDFKEKLEPDGKYGDAAEWFLESPEFETWCETFQAAPEPSNSTDDEPAADRSSASDEVNHNSPKRVLWLRGGYGTGKTTALYHTYLAILNDPKYQLLDKELVIARYFCNDASTAKNRPKHETVIRGMLRRLTLSPDCSLIKPVETLYKTSTRLRAKKVEDTISETKVGEGVSLTKWKEVFGQAIASNAERCHYVLIVDALDECVDSSEVEKLLIFMRDVLKKHANVSLLCSSHVQVSLGDYFGPNNSYIGADMLLPMDVIAEKTAKQIKRFINEEIEGRRPIAKKSVFYKDESLLEQLKTLLHENACGMFEWVKVWLNICLSKHDVVKTTIQSSTVAKKLLRQLREDTTHEFEEYKRMEQAYERLWSLNSTVDSEELGTMTRLFEFILAAFEPGTPELLSIALRIQGDLYDDYPSPEDIQHLYSNFLEFQNLTVMGVRTNSRRLKFVHSSARHFVMNKLCPQNASANDGRKSWEARLAKQTNMSITKLYLDVMSSVTHPFLQALDINIQDWRLMALDRNARGSLNTGTGRSWRIPQTRPSGHFFNYMATEGLRHVALAAEERSICEPIWRDVIDHVILNPQSAFCYTLIMGLYPAVEFGRLLAEHWRVFQEQQESLDLLPIHTLVCLNLMQEIDLDVLCGRSVHIDQIPRRIGSPAAMPQFIESAMHRGIALPRGVLTSFDATALQLACAYRNAMAVRTILQAVRFHHPRSMNDQLCKFSHLYPPLLNFPLAIAIQNIDLETIKLLLDADKVGSNSPGISSDATHEYFVSKQWACKTDSFYGLLLLHQAINTFASKEMRQIFEVARPEEIDLRDSRGRTALHKAVQQEDQGLVSMLIEEYGADPNPLDDGGASPAFIAFMLDKGDTLKYFQSHGVSIEFPSHKRGAWKKDEAVLARLDARLQTRYDYERRIHKQKDLDDPRSRRRKEASQARRARSKRGIR